MHSGPSGTRSNHLHFDATLQLHSERPGKPLESGLTRSVGGKTWGGKRSGHTADKDDLPLGIQKIRKQDTSDENGRGEIDPDEVSKGIFRLLAQVAEIPNTGVVNNDVKGGAANSLPGLPESLNEVGSSQVDLEIILNRKMRKFVNGAPPQPEDLIAGLRKKAKQGKPKPIGSPGYEDISSQGFVFSRILIQPLGVAIFDAMHRSLSKGGVGALRENPA